MIKNFDIESFLRNALAEDIGPGDVTSNALMPADRQAAFAVNARVELVVCGAKFLSQLFALIDASVRVDIVVPDGTLVKPGTKIATISGPARALLAGERTALNLLQHLSGVATLTRAYVDAVMGTGAKIYDTRKTIPGLRYLQKYAVACGGGENHRMGLYDAMLIKDNHIAVMGSVAAAVAAARKYADTVMLNSFQHPSKEYFAADAARWIPKQVRDDTPLTIEVECDTLVQVNEAIAAKADIILLDNMNNTALREGATRCKASGIISEASGNVSLATVRGIAETGVERISIGKLTHSAVAVDIGLDAV